MDINNRLIAPCGKTISPENIYFDLDSFVKRILLFDHYILDSLGLLELPYLIKIFTFNGLIDLLESGALSINLFPVNTASRGPSFMGDYLWPGMVRPPFNYSLAVISPADPYEYVNHLFSRILPRLQLSGRQSPRLKKTIYSAMAKPQTQINSLSIQSTVHDMLTFPQLLSKSCSYAAKKKLNRDISPSKIKLGLTQHNQFEFKVENNFQADFGFNQLDTHQIIESAILMISGRYDIIEQMKWYSAISGFKNEDLPLFTDKFDFLIENLSPEIKEKRFQRVIEIRGLNQIGTNNDIKINARQLLAIREKPECLNFRHWLSNVDDLTDKQISDLGNSLLSKIGGFSQSTPGKVIRFFATNIIGFVTPPGVSQFASLGLSVLDTFLLDRIFVNKPEPLIFIDEMYPSIFKD